MSQSPSLSFGPAWMRPKPSRHSSQDVTPRSSSLSQTQAWGNSTSTSSNAPVSSNNNSQIDQQASQISSNIFNNHSNSNAYQQQAQYQQEPLQPEDNHSNENYSTRINKVYTIDELTQIWKSIQDELQRKGYDEKYRSLGPIRELIQQVESDHQIQKQYQQSYQQQHQQHTGYKRYDENSAQVSQLTDKLHEINNWAKTENTLDFASILTSVSSNANLLNNNIGMKTNSPFTSKPMLHRDTSFQTLNSPLVNHRSLSQSNFLHQNAQPPTQPQLLQPADTKWYYLDMDNNQQGPFTGDLMDSWYKSNYFVPSLKLRRENEVNYYTLEEFINIVNNHESPFLTPLPNLTQPLAAPIATTPSFSAFNQFDNHTIGNQLYQTNTSFINPLAPQPQLPQLQQAQQTTWASHSGRASPWTSNQNIHDLSANEFRLGAHSPFLSNANSFLNDTSSTILNQQTQQQQQQQQQIQTQSAFGTISQQPRSSTLAQDDGLLEQINSQIFNGTLPELNSNEAPSNIASDSVAPVANVSESTPEIENFSSSVPAAFNSVSPTQTESQAQAQVETFVPTPAPETNKEDSKQGRSTSTRSSVSKARSEKKEVKKLVTESSKADSEPVKAKPQLAPWANKAVQNEKPQFTLDQIQQLEAKESAKQLKLKAEKDKLLAAQMLAAAEREAELASTKTASLPSTSSWGKPQAKAAAPTKTLLDIQREEAEAEAKAAAVAMAKLAINGATPPSAAPTPKNSFASIATPPNTNPWTTVAAKKPAPVKVAPKAPQTTSAKINPDVLRSVSASSVPSTVASSTSTTTRVSPRQEFLAWCRSSMKLNRGINENEVLQILLMLPLGIESQEIIADTIYSNSTTMDGRRFAQEFLKRRKIAEDQINDGLSWNDALHISVEDDDDGWDFQVVGKKNKRRN